MIEQSSLFSEDFSKMADLDDLNGALYDIDAQDLLDVWDAMDSGTCETALSCINGGTNISWNGLLRQNSLTGTTSASATPVLKDKLLTDCVNLEFPAVSHEHSYSMGGKNDKTSGNSVASDGDSMPESPLSLNDDMETECYPCIPMHTASNQHRQITTFIESTNTLVKVEASDEDINVVDDEDQLVGSASSRPRRQSCLVRKSQASVYNNNTNTGRLNDVKMSPIRQTVRLARPKHPQSLLKQPPVLLMTSSINQNCITTTLPMTTTTRLLTVPKDQQTNDYAYRSSADWSSPAPSPSSSCSSSTSAGRSLLHNNTQNNCNRAPIQTPLISSQPKDGCGELILTEEEKKTLLSEGYPIPTKLPLTKAEERSLKKIRRKIKNKISAQESRRKKKEFVDLLERKVDEATTELEVYKKKCDQLQKDNLTLVEQVRYLKAMLENSKNENGAQGFKIEPIDDTSDGISGEIDLD